MTENTLSEVSRSDELSLQRAIVWIAGLLAGAAAARSLSAWVPAGGGDPQGAASALAWGSGQAGAGLQALLLVALASAGILLAELAWKFLAQVQRGLGTLPSTASLRRSAAGFAVFLTLVQGLSQGTPVVVWPLVLFLGVSSGFLLLALFENTDKRKIFFAHPTESDYSPVGLFVHGGLLALGLGVGWFLQSIPGARWMPAGFWPAAAVGVGVWLGVILISGGMSRLYSKSTFDQVYLALALACLPLALLPLQCLTWYHYLDTGKAVGGFELSWLPIALGLVVGLSVVVLWLVLLVRLRERPVEIHPEWEDLFQALMLIAGIPLLVLALGYQPEGAVYGQAHLTGTVDVVREGEPLALAQAIQLGRLPFKELLFRHGFMSDGLSGLVALQGLGGSLESFRWLLTLLTPLGLVAVYWLSIFCLPWMWALGTTLLVLTGHLGSIPVTRFFFVFGGLVFTFYYLQNQRWVILLFSALATVLALIGSYTAGLMALTSQLALMLGFLAFGQEPLPKRLLGLGAYLGGLLVLFLPWGLYLAFSGSLADYWENGWWTLTQYEKLFSPGHLGTNWMENLVLAVPPLLVSLGVVTLLHAVWTKREERNLPWNVLVLTPLVALFWLRMLKRGDALFLQEALPVFGVLGGYFLYRLSSHQSHLKAGIGLVVTLILLLPSSGQQDLLAQAGRFGQKNWVPVADLGKSKLKGMENLYLPAEQARSLEQVVDYLDGQVGSSETFYDFSDQPILFFLVPRQPATQALTAGLNVTLNQQINAIRELSVSPVKAVIWAGRLTPSARGNHLPPEIGQYALSEYLLKTFVPTTLVGPQVVLVPRGPYAVLNPEAATAMIKVLDWGGLPQAWGQEAKYASAPVLATWSASEGSRAIEPAGLTLTAQGTGWQVGASQGPVKLRLSRPAAENKPANVLRLELSVSPGLKARSAKLGWGEEGRSLSFTLTADGQKHAYALRVGSIPGWVLGGGSDKLTLELPGGDWTWHSLVSMNVSDVAEVGAGIASPAQVPAKPTGVVPTAAATVSVPAATAVSPTAQVAPAKVAAKPTVRPAPKPKRKPTAVAKPVEEAEPTPVPAEPPSDPQSQVLEF